MKIVDYNFGCIEDLQTPDNMKNEVFLRLLQSHQQSVTEQKAVPNVPVEVAEPVWKEETDNCIEEFLNHQISNNFNRYCDDGLY